MSNKRKNERSYGTNLSGKRIKEARNKKGMDQAELTAALEIEQGIKLYRSALGLIEQQKRKVSDLELVAFSRVLKVSISWLLFGDEQEDIK